MTARAMSASFWPVTLEVVPSGGHGAGMVQQAIPRVISWIQRLPGFQP